MTENAGWTPLGEVDYDKDVDEGFIELSQVLADAAGSHSVLVIRCKKDGAAESPSDLQLKVKIVGRLKPVVSNADWGALNVVEYGAEIKGRKLTLGEKAKRIASRTALPILLLLAALAALVGVLFPELKDAMDIVTAGLTIPAAVVAAVKAIGED